MHSMRPHSYNHLLYQAVFMLCALLLTQAIFAKDRFPVFTNTETQWIQANSVVKFSIHEKYRPYWDSGIYPKLLSKLKDCSGLQFQAVWRNTEQIAIEQIRNEEIQFIIDPNPASHDQLPGVVSDPIFWGQDVVISSNTNLSTPIELDKPHALFFDRGYDFTNQYVAKKKINSSELITKKLLSGEAQLAVMPLRLAISVVSQLNLDQYHIKPLGHQPFAYRWLLSEKAKVLNSIVQKSLREVDPIILGELLSVPTFTPKELRLPSHIISIYHHAAWMGILMVLLLLSSWALFHRKKQAKKEANLLAIAKDAKNANEAKSAFLATVSHEIRTPMNAVIGAQELLLRNATLNSKQRELLQSAHTSAAALLGILNQVLDLAKIESGKFTIELEPSDLKQIVSEINQTFSIYAQNKGLTLTSFIDPCIADLLLLDPLCIRQILHNLLSNAIKFTECGTIYFEVRILANDHAGQLLEFRIIDQGIGMAKHDIERVLMPFEQIRSHLSSNNEPGSGTGLGLSISNHLINLMQSQLMIDSAPNYGTSAHFVVALSRTNQITHQEKSGANTHEPASFNDIRALVVEDHPANRQILSLQLQTLGIHADQCTNGNEAISKITSQNYDIVLTDHSMPGMHGTVLAKTIRSMGFHDLLIIGITADIYANQTCDYLMSSGMNAVLIKPISLETLQNQLKNLLGKRITPSLDTTASSSFEMKVLILEEVLKVQMETLEILISNSISLDLSEIKSYIHKIKGGALLSEDQKLHQRCAELEQSTERVHTVIESFKTSLMVSNQSLEEQIRTVKLMQPSAPSAN